MRQFFTNTDTMTSDCAKSLAAVYPDRFQIIPDSYNGRAILRKPLHPERVNIIVSGDGGYPLTAGYVAEKLADASVNGNHCTAPSAYDIYEHLLKDLKPAATDKLHLLVSRMEKTRCEEAFILAKAINDYSASHHEISKMNVGYHSSIMEDYGFFVTIMCEDEILRPFTSGTVQAESFVL